MKQVRPIFRAMLYCVLLIKVLGPAAALAQQPDVGRSDNVIDYAPETKILGANFSFQALLPTANSSSLSPDKAGEPGDAGAWMQSVTLEWDWNRVNTSVAYAFSAPTGQHAAGVANSIFSEYWTTSVTSGTTLYLNKDKGTSADVSTDWEVQGQKQRASGTPAVLGESFTMEWGVTQLLPLNRQMTKVLQFGVAGYDEWLNARNGGTFPGALSVWDGRFSMHAAGFQTNLILPEKNLLLSFKYEPAYLARAPAPRRIVIFGISWTW
jgi:hypothetical protein